MAGGQWCRGVLDKICYPGFGCVLKGFYYCLWIFARWHAMHVFTHSVMSLLRPGQMNRRAISSLVVRTPGCDKRCTVSYILRRRIRGMYGRISLVETSQYIVCSESSRRSLRSCKFDIDDVIRSWSSSCFNCSRAMSSVETIIGMCISWMRDNASATVFSFPGRWTRWVVNWAM